MKFTVTMKDPDALSEAVREAVENEVNALLCDPDERDTLQEVREEKTLKICNQWFEYGEYLRIKIDTEAGTATVLKANA